MCCLLSFRPLPGIHVFRSRRRRRPTCKPRSCFRPLPGIHVFRSRADIDPSEPCMFVSVPFRGFTSFGVAASMFMERPNCFGFRPLPGIHVFRSGFNTEWDSDSLPRFRPLPGIHVFRRFWFFACHVHQVTSFRPLPGIHVFRRGRWGGGYGLLKLSFPSPSGDSRLSEFPRSG